MKTIELPKGWKAWLCFLVMNAMALVCFSQDATGGNSDGGSTKSSTTTTTVTHWWVSPWVWVVGVVVLLLIVISLSRGSSTKETTIIKD